MRGPWRERCPALEGRVPLPHSWNENPGPFLSHTSGSPLGREARQLPLPLVLKQRTFVLHLDTDIEMCVRHRPGCPHIAPGGGMGCGHYLLSKQQGSPVSNPEGLLCTFKIKLIKMNRNPAAPTGKRQPAFSLSQPPSQPAEGREGLA